MKMKLNALKDGTEKYYSDLWKNLTTQKVLRRISNQEPVIKPLIELARIKTGDRIIDLGTGPGTIAISLAQAHRDKAIEVHGIDISKEALEVASRAIIELKLNSIYLERADIEHIPFRDDFFNIVVSQATINLLLDKHKAFQEIARVAKPCGVILISDCIRKKQVCGDACLWYKCISGAPTLEKFYEYAENASLKIVDSLNLTAAVRSLVESKLWNWPEFVEYDMEYCIFKLEKE